MRLRARAGWFLVALTAAVSVSPADTRTQPPKRRVWNGTVIEERAFSYGGRIRPVSGDVAEYFHNIRVDFRYVEEAVPSGGWRPVSRRLTWTGRGRALAPGYTMTECNGADSFDLDAIPAGDVTRRLTIPCTTTRYANYFGFFKEPPDRINVPALVSEDQLRDNCSYAEERPGYKYSVWLGEDYEAVVDVDTGPDSAYTRFAPAPGLGLQLSVRTSPATPSLFRFVLQRDEVSRFPGYATNAVVNDAFLDGAGMSHLRGRYGNEDPDWIFDERDFENKDLWGVVRGDEVQTTTLQGSATVTVTAMDYGAAGKLRAYVKGTCGAWQPARFAVAGQSRDALALPFDEDGNLIADALPEYAGKAERDDDEEPKGNGTAGDGLTAFEEYRGFATQGGDCAKRSQDFIVRTDPRRKDLFIHAPDPELAASTAHFEWASGVAVHLICEPHYVDNAQRVVNFTLQRDGFREWNGTVVSQRVPQHGLFINDQVPPYGMSGIACVNPPDCTRQDTGPPQHTAIIMVDKPEMLAIGGAVVLVQVTTHEIGHGVGLAHHSDSIQDWTLVEGRLNFPASEWDRKFVPFIVGPGSACVDPRVAGASKVGVPLYLDGKFVGCGATRLIVRTGQHSGDAECPMRYTSPVDPEINLMFYEAPGSKVTSTFARINQQDEEPPKGKVSEFMLFAGELLPYQHKDDFYPLGRFCRSKIGTLLNAVERGALNHAGDAAVGRCQDFIVINDLVLAGRK